MEAAGSMKVTGRLLRRGITMAALLALLAPAAAHASTRQMSIIQDDAVFLGLTPKVQEFSLAESKGLGADAVHIVMSWRRASPGALQREIPAGFNPSNPRSQGGGGYNWAPYDFAIASAKRQGLKVILDLSPSIPYWGSSEPERCPHFVGGKQRLGLGCYWKPDPRLFGQFTRAVATRYRNYVDYYSLYNEPNIENFLYPQTQKTRSGTVDLGGKMYRQLWIAGFRAIRKYDRKRAGRVLFGETAAISSPRDTLFSALCLNKRGRPFRGAMKRLQGCSKPSRLPIAGLAVHPYNNNAVGSVHTRTSTRASMPMAYLDRATRLLKVAERYHRVPRRRGVYVTETGFQTRPPSRRGLTLDGQARAINEFDRLLWGDRRIRSTAQFELYDVPEGANQDVFNTGLRQLDGTRKPSWFAYRMPLVVTRLAHNRVEVWGQVRPARGRVRALVEVARSPTARFRRLRTVRTNRAGYFRFFVRSRSAKKRLYRASWRGLQSRTARAGRPIRYRG
jgi:hypothetical protein